MACSAPSPYSTTSTYVTRSVKIPTLISRPDDELASAGDGAAAARAAAPTALNSVPMRIDAPPVVRHANRRPHETFASRSGRVYMLPDVPDLPGVVTPRVIALPERVIGIGRNGRSAWPESAPRSVLR